MAFPAPAAWAVAGLVLAGLEMLAPGVFMLPIGLAALGTAAATALLLLGWHGQVAVFVALTLALVGAAWQLRRRRPAGDPVNAPSAGLLGQTCHAIAFQDGEGRVRLGDTTWSARAQGPSPNPGQPLRVVGLQGTVLLVATAEQTR